jgi:hypothetical protein
VRCLLHACRSYAARTSLPALRMPLHSTLGHLRRSSLKGQALARAAVEVPAEEQGSRSAEERESTAVEVLAVAQVAAEVLGR